eukprot:TRINITY_DN14019_c0_g1_i2.p1 TRINITY_DN14019_c0_g1~~TRINITY_DN14019_c0_g1_i2.p1  ORF type:complete len:185 (-),score=-6.84 TRINITY_DN14019_c0_g1_i2:163-717(-)
MHKFSYILYKYYHKNVTQNSSIEIKSLQKQANLESKTLTLENTAFCSQAYQGKGVPTISYRQKFRPQKSVSANVSCQYIKNIGVSQKNIGDIGIWVSVSVSTRILSVISVADILEIFVTTHPYSGVLQKRGGIPCTKQNSKHTKKPQQKTHYRILSLTRPLGQVPIWVLILGAVSLKPHGRLNN